MFWTIVALVLVGLVFVMIEVWIPQMIIYLAGTDALWSPWKSMAPEGEMYMLARGAPDGPFEMLLDSVPDHVYNPGTNEFDDLGPGGKVEEVTYLSKLGVVYVGFNLRLMKKETKYEKYELIPATNKWGLVQKIRPGPSIYFQYNMGTKVEAAETVGNFRISAIMVFTAQIKNPVKAMFFAGSWESQTNAAVQGVLREYIGTKTIDQLREEKAVGGTTTLVKMVKDLNLLHFGVEIIDARFVDFDLVSDDAETSKAVRAMEIAKLEGRAKIEAANLGAQALVAEAKGKREAKKIIAVGLKAEFAARKKHDPTGVLNLAEAIRETKITALSLDGSGVIATVSVNK